MKKRIFYGILLVIIVSMFYGIHLFNKTIPSLDNVAADFTFNSNNLIGAFSEDTEGMDFKLKDKIIGVEGVPTKINERDSFYSLEFDHGGTFVVNCVFESKKYPNLTKDKPIEIKCRYQGYLPEDALFDIPGEIKLNKCVVLD